MKKLCIFFALIMTAATVAVFLSSCGDSTMQNVSERRDGYYFCSGDLGDVTAASGVRETPYELDGKVGALKPYTLITLSPAAFDPDAVYTYTAVCGGAVYGGTLIPHPFAASYSAEIDARLTDNVRLRLVRGEQTADYEMRRSGVTVGCAQAIECARKTFRPKGEYEIRARLINNPIGGEGLCWYVLVASGEGRNGVLLDSATGAVLAKK